MHQELKAKWVKALRSGEFKQAKNVLYDPKTGGYCCYGVLREVAKPGDTRSAGKEDSCLSADQLREYGIDPFKFERSLLECMNDGQDPDKHYGVDRQHTFQEIADWIERNI